ncbi:MAG: GNAT family N-acetyltransferase [Acidimicrobiia bacterium]
MADYPSKYELDIVLRDGDTVTVRPITPADGQLLVRFFERLGPESRYFRFFRVKTTLSPEEVRFFTTVDYDDRMALVVIDEGEIVAVGRYDRSEEDPETGEVAFAVADDHQGRGIGTQLLQLLTPYARTHGISRFRAFVLPENVQMMRVFRNSGFALGRTMEDGIFTVAFPVAPTPDSLAASEEREKRSVAASVLPLFFPRSIAVIGASTKPDAIGGKLFGNLLREGFTGPLYPVNPNAQVVNSIRAYPSIAEVPDEVDLAFIVVPARHVLDVVRECADKGVRGLVVISAGFSEVGGEGAEMEQELLELVRGAGMRMVGPNCMGLLNTAPSVRMNGTFAPVYPPTGNIAMSSQSGALGIAILDYTRRHDLGISQFVSVGNKADISSNDLLLAWEDDPTTDVILLYLESFGNPRRFARLARRIARNKPIVAVKSGRTRAGSRAASSHTGALASMDVAVDALFEQTGVIRVDTLEQLFGTASLLANQPIPNGRRVGVITNAGGPAILAADALEGHGLVLPELSADLQERMRTVLPAEASTRNPVDLIASGGPEAYAHTLRLMFESDQVDSVVVIYVPTSMGGAARVAAAISEVAGEYEGSTTLLSVFMQSDEEGVRLTGRNGRAIPTHPFPESAAMALAHAVGYGEWRTKELGTVPDFDDLDRDATVETVARALNRLGAGGGWLEQDEIEDLLDAVRIPRPASGIVATEDEAVALAGSIGYPVVLKVIAASALHKSDVGGVALDLGDEEAVRLAFRSVTAAVDDAEGVLVQEMVAGGHEVLVGMTEDPNFGPLLVYGLGGVYVELLKDVAFRLYPLTDVEAAEMISEIRGADLLRGYRGMPEGDLDAIRDVLLRASALVGLVPEIDELDLNPVKVLEPGKGARVVDARIRVAPVPPSWSPELVDLPGVRQRPR